MAPHRNGVGSWISSTAAMSSMALPLQPPPIGTRGFRVLDELRFVCEVVGVTADRKTLSVRFTDDATVENGVELDEFEPELPSPEERHTVSRPSAMTVARFVYPETTRWSPAPCILDVAATYLEPFEWLASLVRVNNEWRSRILSSPLWRTVRIRSRVQLAPRLLDTRLDDAAVAVHEVLTAIVLDDSEATDDQVASLVMRCPQLQSISLQRCQRLSFMVVYELLCLSRDRHAAGNAHLQSLDLWLCRGISPAFVTKFHRPTGDAVSPPKRHSIDIRGPGFFFLDVSNHVFDALRSVATTAPPKWPTETTALDVLWFPESLLLKTIDHTLDDPQWHAIRRHVPVLKASALAGVVPLVRFENLQPRTVCLGIPASIVQDLTRLSQQLEPCPDTRTQALESIRLLKEKDASSMKTPPPEDPLTAQAERVFAMLRETTEQLQDQVDRLETQVAAMAMAKLAAEKEYKHAQRDLQRVAREVDRAVLCLATSPSTSPTGTPGGIDPPPQNGITQTFPGDSLLPPLPSSDKIEALAESLDQKAYAVLDGFVGDQLSSTVHVAVKQMYESTRATDTEPPSLVPSSSTLPPVPTSARFTRGELAGGNTGRNLRYQMAHVRGDYMLWLGEEDAFCPPPVRLVLRQLDRLILERLSTRNHELSMSPLLRKKAMVTCYPGADRARYTRHCDNPNRNGRKLTAILYLNKDWDPHIHGGELLLHLSDTNETRAVAPLLDRLVLFFSDMRVPHQVLPCKDAARNRFALTVWYLDYDEYMHAQVFGTTSDDSEAVERRRIEGEIERLRRETHPMGADGETAA